MSLGRNRAPCLMAARARFPPTSHFQRHRLSRNVGNRAKPRSVLRQSALFRAARPLRNRSQHVDISRAAAPAAPLQIPTHFTRFIMVRVQTRRQEPSVSESSRSSGLPGPRSRLFERVSHQRRPFLLLVFSPLHPFPAAASVPASETESVNTENQNGEEEKTTCCGPLW